MLTTPFPVAELQNKKAAVFQEVAPPAGHDQKAGCRMLANRSIEYNGPKHLKVRTSSKNPRRNSAKALSSTNTSTKTSSTSSKTAATSSASTAASPRPSRAKVTGKATIVLDSDDDAPLAPKPKPQRLVKSEGEKKNLEKIHVDGGRPAKHFVNNSEDEAYSPSVLESPSPYPKFRQISATDLFASDDEDEDILPVAEETPKPRTRQAAKNRASSSKTTTATAPVDDTKKKSKPAPCPPQG
ncbi:hypothetical protein EST38_g13541 [Candolleomyces aberdarensis]|uniref:Uncharacterized protein n=1 Tax=Candolleomyces aberdarensis TaxID=2316362 RepID=A0A4Q2D2E2_9AGAR|nr:hypothetical protein EST38_g13541 [Candolleomyces aberdarensis]